MSQSAVQTTNQCQSVMLTTGTSHCPHFVMPPFLRAASTHRVVVPNQLRKGVLTVESTTPPYTHTQKSKTGCRFTDLCISLLCALLPGVFALHGYVPAVSSVPRRLAVRLHLRPHDFRLPKGAGQSMLLPLFRLSYV